LLRFVFLCWTSDCHGDDYEESLPSCIPSRVMQSKFTDVSGNELPPS
jgi:hypothetical protein